MTETKQNTDTRLQLLLALIVLVIGLAGGYDLAKHHFEDMREMITDTVYVYHWDTLIVEKPTEIVRYVVRYDTLRTSEIVNVTDSALLKKLDSLNLTIPIEQAVYSDSTENARYTAYVSGFRAALDSIQIDCKNTERVITNTITREPRRLSFGLQLGVGVSTQGVALPYFGVGAQYRLW